MVSVRLGSDGTDWGPLCIQIKSAVALVRRTSFNGQIGWKVNTEQICLLNAGSRERLITAGWSSTARVSHSASGHEMGR